MPLTELLDRLQPTRSVVTNDEKSQLICGELSPLLSAEKNGSICGVSVFRRYLNLKTSPPKQDDGSEVYWNSDSDGSVLDHALTQTTKTYDWSAVTVRSLHIHNVYTGEDQTVPFLYDVKTVQAEFNEA